MSSPDTMTPSEAKNAVLTIAAQLSRCRTRLGELRALYAKTKAELLGGGNKISEIKILADASDVGQEIFILDDYTQGLDEVLKALKKSIQIMHEEVRGNI
jgi:hypothetical protein